MNRDPKHSASSGITMDELLGQSLAPTVSGLSGTSAYSYRSLYANAANLSFSNLETFCSCPRKYELHKLSSQLTQEQLETNINFCFGHAVAAGVQHYLAFGDEQEAIKQTLFAWNADLLLEDEKKKDKSIWSAIGAVQIFIGQYADQFHEWEVAHFKGKPAIEFSFKVDLQNSYFYFGHVDLILVHKTTKQLMVVELKTNGSNTINDAMYSNSPQALGYTIILDQLAAELESPEQFLVFYLIYKTKTKEFISMPFPKTSLHKANWIRTLLLQCEELDRYTEAGFFPKRHSGCFVYQKQCPYYGVCDMSNKSLTPYASLADIKFPSEEVSEDYQFKLIDLIQTQIKLGES